MERTREVEVVVLSAKLRPVGRGKELQGTPSKSRLWKEKVIKKNFSKNMGNTICVKQQAFICNRSRSVYKKVSPCIRKTKMQRLSTE